MGCAWFMSPAKELCNLRKIVVWKKGKGRVYSCFSFTWGDGHVGVQNNGRRDVTWKPRINLTLVWKNRVDEDEIATVRRLQELTFEAFAFHLREWQEVNPQERQLRNLLWNYEHDFELYDKKSYYQSIVSITKGEKLFKSTVEKRPSNPMEKNLTKSHWTS